MIEGDLILRLSGVQIGEVRFKGSRDYLPGGPSAPCWRSAMSTTTVAPLKVVVVRSGPNRSRSSGDQPSDGASLGPLRIPFPGSLHHSPLDIKQGHCSKDLTMISYALERLAYHRVVRESHVFGTQFSAADTMVTGYTVSDTYCAGA